MYKFYAGRSMRSGQVTLNYMVSNFENPKCWNCRDIPNDMKTQGVIRN